MWVRRLSLVFQVTLGAKLLLGGLNFPLKGISLAEQSLGFTRENVLNPKVRIDSEGQCLVNWGSDKEVNGHFLVIHQIHSVQDAMFCVWEPSVRETAKDRMVDN